MTRSLEINVNDPGVKRLLGVKVEVDGAKRERERVHLAGDMDTGLSSTVHLSEGKREVEVTYKHGPDEYVLTVDVYTIPGEPICVNLICPRCHHALRVDGARKDIEFDVATGKLSIAPFQCTWELDTTAKHVTGLVGGGLTLCKWTAAIDRNVAKDA